MKELAQTDVGRGRMALRLALNEKSLPAYLNALLFNDELTHKYYHEYALMRVEEHHSIVLMLLEALQHAVRFQLYVKDARVNNANYWSQCGAVQQLARARSDFPAAQLAPDALALRKQVLATRADDERAREQHLLTSARAAQDAAEQASAAAVSSAAAATAALQAQREAVERERAAVERDRAELARREAELHAQQREMAAAAASADLPTTGIFTFQLKNNS